MRFTEILFYYDLDGAPLGDVDASGRFAEKPRLLKAVDCNARYFYVSDDKIDGSRGVTVYRCYGSLTKDPYNDDDRPPTVMFSMAHVEINLSGVLELNGFERPNLSWAGLLRPPYECCAKNRRRRVKYLTEERVKAMRYMPSREWRRQRVVLLG